jgi:hypothetical protein
MLDDLDGPSVLMVGCGTDEIEHVISSSSIEDKNAKCSVSCALFVLGRVPGWGEVPGVAVSVTSIFGRCCSPIIRYRHSVADNQSFSTH